MFWAAVFIIASHITSFSRVISSSLPYHFNSHCFPHILPTSYVVGSQDVAQLRSLLYRTNVDIIADFCIQVEFLVVLHMSDL